MAIPVVSDLDLDRNQLLNITLDRQPGEPTAANSWEGRVIWDDNVNIVKYYDGAAWIPVGAGTVATIANGGAMNVIVSGGTVTISPKVDNATLEIAADALQVRNLGIGTTKLADNAVTTIKLTDKCVTLGKIQDLPAMTVIGRVAAGNGAPTTISIISDTDLVGASHTTLATSQAVKVYVDNKVASLGELLGPWDASTATGFPGGAGVKKGDYRRVSVGGTVNGVTFQPGDIIQAAVAAPSTTLAADWIFIQANVDQATTTVLGLMYLATVAEVQAGTDNLKAVTPATLAALTATEARAGLSSFATEAEAQAGTVTNKSVTPAGVKAAVTAGVRARSFYSIVGNGSSSTFTFTHSFNSFRTYVIVMEQATRREVFVEYERTPNTIVLKFTKVVPLGKYELVVFNAY